jgi:hypothetical protein
MAWHGLGTADNRMAIGTTTIQRRLKMGFLDFFTGKKKCPICGTRGAKEIKGRIHCPNPTCSYFSKMLGKSDAVPARASITFSQPADVPDGSVAIQYRNFRGVEKTFVGEAASARRSQNHITVKVAPQGTRIALARDRILNLNEVEAALPQRLAPGQDRPTPQEVQVLNYHTKCRSTSRLYESIRAKYPNW